MRNTGRRAFRLFVTMLATSLPLTVRSDEADPPTTVADAQEPPVAQPPEPAVPPPPAEPAPPAAPAAPEAPRLRLGASVDVYYAHNTNRPANRANFYPGVGTSAKRDSEFSLNLANVDLAVDPAPVGLRLILAAGTATEVVHAGEPEGVFVGPSVWRHVQQASVSYKTNVGRGLLLEGGIFPCHVGWEVLAPKDNWNYTRSWLGELSPYYVTGAKGTFTLNDRWSLGLHVLNGWQNIAENNKSKTFGTSLAYSKGRVSASWNTMVGRDIPGNDEDWRLFSDLLLTVKATDRVSFGASLDLANEGRSEGDSVSWQAFAGYVRIAPNDRWAFAIRGEFFRDPDAAISGASQTLSEGTGTIEYKPAGNLIVRLEGRYDHSTAAVFAAREPDQTKKNQFLLVLGAIATF